MTDTEKTLWGKIADFEFDNSNDSFQFSDRVSRENGWTKIYSVRVIEEYRKFIFLCCVADEGVTPSDPVDQVWHLHLTFTKSYWIDFCRNTLEKEIHHNPTKGGQAEGQKFDIYYTRLQELYRLKFKTDPPSDIWHPNKIRFTDINFRRVNLKKYWLIKKPSLRIKQHLLILLVIAGGMLSIQASSDTLSMVIFAIVAIVIIILALINKGKGNSGGCSSASDGAACSAGTGHHHSGDSGCGSGCSGCSSSGCSGCGSGD